MRVILTLTVSSFLLGPLGAQVLEQIGTVKTGTSAEIAAFDTFSKLIFVANIEDKRIDVVDISNPESPVIVTPAGGFDLALRGPTSVDAREGVVAVSVVHPTKTENGSVIFFDAGGSFISEVVVGALPDMLRFTPDGTKVVVANEGEPSDDYTVDPEGSISVIDLSAGVAAATVQTAGFGKFNQFERALRNSGVRIFGPGATVAQDLEPEYVAISADSEKAWVTLQENNAIAVVTLADAKVREIHPLGFKPHILPGNGLDGGKDDGMINIANWPVFGMYEPDAIAFFEVGGKTFLATANEGDVRDFDGFSEETVVGDVDVNRNLLKDYPDLQNKAGLKALKITNSPPAGKIMRNDGTEVYNALFTFGGRSFSIWTAGIDLVFDSGDQFEQITATTLPDYFNCNSDAKKRDNRSDDKGPEPEGITVGEVAGVTYAFIVLERIGGIMVYDVSDPHGPEFVEYVNNRDWSVTDWSSGDHGDTGPEGVIFIPGVDSPSGLPLLVVSNEVSGTVTIYEVGAPAPSLP